MHRQQRQAGTLFAQLAETERISHTKNDDLRSYLDKRMSKIIDKPFTRTISTKFGKSPQSHSLEKVINSSPQHKSKNLVPVNRGQKPPEGRWIVTHHRMRGRKLNKDGLNDFASPSPDRRAMVKTPSPPGMRSLANEPLLNRNPYEEENIDDMDFFKHALV